MKFCASCQGRCDVRIFQRGLLKGNDMEAFTAFIALGAVFAATALLMQELGERL